MNTKKTAKAVLATFGLSVLLPTAAMAAVDTQNHWAGSVMEKWEKQALLGGYEDGTIRPDGQITRAEFVALVNRAGGYQAAANAVTFSDVKAGDWYAGQVAAAVNQGYIGGFEDGTFRPNENITREQAAAIIARIHKLPSDPARAEKFADADSIAAWAKGVVGAVANAGYMVGDNNNNFNGAKAMTRAEVVSSLDRVFKIEDVKAEKLTISLSQPIGTINKGAVKTITVTASVKDAVIKATSSNPSVATVTVEGNKVIIRGLEKGSVTISITASAPGYQDAVVTSDSAVAVGGGSSSGGGSYVPPTTKPEVEVKPSDAVQEEAAKKADQAINNTLPEAVKSAGKVTEETKTTAINDLNAKVTAPTATASEKVAAQAAAEYLATTGETEVTVEKLQEVAKEAVKVEVQVKTQEVAEDVNAKINTAVSGETVTVAVPEILQETAEKITVTPANTVTQAKVQVGESESIVLNQTALSTLELSVVTTGGAASDEVELTVDKVLQHVENGDAALSTKAKSILQAKQDRGNGGEVLAKGTISYTGGSLSVDWSGISALSDEEAANFMKNFNIGFTK